MVDAPSLSVTNVEGAVRQCGRLYGEQERESILGFLTSQISIRPRLLKFASGCWSNICETLPVVAEFCEGLAEGANLTTTHTTLLLLHEEVLHQEHCSIVGVSRAAACDGRSLVAQNWDWPATMYAWPKLLRLRTDSAPATLTYSFPGLWACAGVNDEGLAIGWSGAGYWPNVPPIRGVPTYALLAGLLLTRDVSEALDLLNSRCHAGSFIFFLADRAGELAVVEGWPGGLSVARNCDVELRTNHFLSPAAVSAVHQPDPASITESTTAQRLTSLQSLVASQAGRIDGIAIRNILSHEDVRAAYDIDEVGPGYNSMTIDSLCIYPDNSQMWVARGLPDRHTFVCYPLVSECGGTLPNSQDSQEGGISNGSSTAAGGTVVSRREEAR